MGLAKNERSLVSFWSFNHSPNHITKMELEANALSSDARYVVLSYEFEGFEEYADASKANAGKSSDDTNGGNETKEHYEYQTSFCFLVGGAGGDLLFVRFAGEVGCRLWFGTAFLRIQFDDRR